MKFSALPLFVACLRTIGASTAPKCERLKQSLTYTQDDAPRDLSGILPLVVGRVNQVLEGVLNVEVGYHGGDLQGRVGEHLVTCEVTRLASALPSGSDLPVETDAMGREIVTQCFEVPFTILDTNECTLPVHHPLRHQCQSPAVCVNTDGSYECVCPRMEDVHDEENSIVISPGITVDDSFWTHLAEDNEQSRTSWEVAYNSTSRTTCPSAASTYGCCSQRAHTKDGSHCREGFRCPIDPCRSSSSSASSSRKSDLHHDCAPLAQCIRKESPVDSPNFSCQCPDGLLGNGHRCRAGVDPVPQPKVMFDGLTPTEETIKNNYYCDCTKPTIDACSGFPQCEGKHEMCVVSAGNVPQCGCKVGYVMHEVYGCVDESPPVMRLVNDPNGDQTLRLKQGDTYTEYAVEIQDENPEEYMRLLKISYSDPLPPGCLTKTGRFHVNYTIATPWTSPDFIQLTRWVVIEDIDECSLDAIKYKKCPQLLPKCDTDAGATCINKVGSYSCKCPKYTSGDGFLSGLSFGASPPVGYSGGAGCRDTTKPIIELEGPNPKTFRVAQCGGINGVILGRKERNRDADLKAAQQKHYGDDIKTIVRQTAGAELCATHDSPTPNASDCVHAYDETHTGRVDLSRDVVVGDPVQQSALHWRVPYNVEDAAKNRAMTVWRDVVVEEIDLRDVEQSIARDMSKKLEAEKKKAVDRALAEERAKTNRRRPIPAPECPKCPACNCEREMYFDASKCENACTEVGRAPNSCPAVEQSNAAVKLILVLSSFIPPPFLTMIFGVAFLYTVLVAMFYILRFLFGGRRYEGYTSVVEHEKNLQQHVTIYNPSPAPSGAGLAGGIGATPIPSSMGGGMGPPPPQQHGGPPRVYSSFGGLNTANSIFSPQTPMNAPTNSFFSPQPTNGNNNMTEPSSGSVDIYARSPIIVPNAQGDGVRQRSPYRY